MMRRLLSVAAFILAVVLVVPVPAGAGEQASRYGAARDGTVYRVRNAETDPELLLEIRHPDQLVEALTIPGTEGDETERFPSLTLDEETVHIVWTARRTIHSALYLASWSPERGWSETVEFSGDPYSTKSNPQIAVTRDRFLDPAPDGSIRERNRTLIHLVWWDESGPGARPLYASLPMVDGDLQGFVDPVNLYEMTELAAPSDTGFPAPAALARRPLVVGTEQGLRLGFVGPRGTDYVILNLQRPARSLESIADEARAQVVIFGMDHPGADIEAVAAHVETTILEAGRDLLAPDVTEYVASQVSERLIEIGGGESLESLADEARAQVIIFGGRLQGGLRSLHDEARAQVIIFGQKQDPGEGRPVLLEGLERNPLPALPENGSVVPMLAAQGVIIAWDEDPETLAYVEFSDEAGNQEIHRLALDEKFNRREALDTLRSRISR